MTLISNGGPAVAATDAAAFAVLTGADDGAAAGEAQLAATNSAAKPNPIARVFRTMSRLLIRPLEAGRNGQTIRPTICRR